MKLYAVALAYCMGLTESRSAFPEKNLVFPLFNSVALKVADYVPHSIALKQAHRILEGTPCDDGMAFIGGLEPMCPTQCNDRGEDGTRPCEEGENERTPDSCGSDDCLDFLDHWLDGNNVADALEGLATCTNGYEAFVDTLPPTAVLEQMLGIMHAQCSGDDYDDLGQGQPTDCVFCDRRSLNKKSNEGFDRKLLMGDMPECCQYEDDCEECVTDFVNVEGACACLLSDCDADSFVPEDCWHCGEEAYEACDGPL